MEHFKYCVTEYYQIAHSKNNLRLKKKKQFYFTANFRKQR
jgi:hypothetical protein